ncbi:MAG: ubiquinol-cytochrome c reductase iron-sulfur subunit [Vicinamibacterales bacterium]
MPAKENGQPCPLPSRRHFCARACHVASLAALGNLLTACGGSPTGPGGLGSALPVVNASSVGGQVTVTIDSGSPLAGVGSAALVQSSAGDFLVGHTAQSTFVALTAMCTHQACTVTNFANALYICPCHGSEYDMNGKVVQGPATAPLREYVTTFNAPTLTITT